MLSDRRHNAIPCRVKLHIVEHLSHPHLYVHEVGDHAVLQVAKDMMCLDARMRAFKLIHQREGVLMYGWASVKVVRLDCLALRQSAHANRVVVLLEAADLRGFEDRGIIRRLLPRLRLKTERFSVGYGRVSAGAGVLERRISQ